MSQTTNIMSLQDLPIKEEVHQLGGKIYSVGGAVRDEWLNKQSKDLDILITGIPMNKLEQLLSKYGKVDAVGKSFGVLKFVPKGSTQDIDVAIPRKERATGEGGHKGFEVDADHNIQLEEDLYRRDFTFNAMAKDMDGNLIDPFGGRMDIAKRTVREVNPDTFTDDPLRMLRAVQFAARFDMDIHEFTKESIRVNAYRINEIAGERILEELRKVVDKGGNKVKAIHLLISTDLYKEIAGVDITEEQISWFEKSIWSDVETLGEFLYMIFQPLLTVEFIYEISEKLKLDNNTENELRALAHADAFKDFGFTDAGKRDVLSRVYSVYPKVLKSGVLPLQYFHYVNEFERGLYPKSIKDLAINGNDLMGIGLKGIEIGKALKKALIEIYSDKVSNSKKDLLNLFAKEDNG